MTFSSFSAFYHFLYTLTLECNNNNNSIHNKSNRFVSLEPIPLLPPNPIPFFESNPITYSYDIIIPLQLFLVLCIIFVILTRQRRVPIVIHYHNTRHPLVQSILKKSGTGDAYFYPHPWLFSGHLQTFLVAMWPHAPVIDYVREILRLPDNGTVALDWSPSFYQSHSNIPMIVILHGLTGGSQETYIRNLAYVAKQQYGWRFCAVNYRGCNGVTLSTPQSYSAGWTEDIRFIINHVKHVIGNKSPLCMVGFSLGANILVKYLGEESRNNNLGITSAVAVGAPFNCLITDQHMNRNNTIQRIYNKHLAKNICKVIESHSSYWSSLKSSCDMDWKDVKIETVGGEHVYLRQVLEGKTVREVDEALTRRIFGFNSVNDYYSDASCDAYLPFIKNMPLLLLSTEDDPICVKDALPFKQVEENEWISLVTIKEGGHLGMFESSNKTHYNHSRGPTLIMEYLAASVESVVNHSE